MTGIIPPRRKLRFRNDSGETAPAFCILEATGAVEVGGQIVVTCSQPTESNFEWKHFFNGAIAVPDGLYGDMYEDSPTWVTVESGTPAFEDEWGPEDGAWGLSENGSGLNVLGYRSADSVAVVKGTAGGAGGQYFIGTVDSAGSGSGYWDVEVTDWPCGKSTVPGENEYNIVEDVEVVMDCITVEIGMQVACWRFTKNDGYPCYWGIVVACCPEN